MIPKIIHYCWFGRKPLSEISKKCIQSWKKCCPEYTIIEWNEDNFDIDCTQFTREAYEKKKWAFVSDYARLKIIYDNGGIYLDTDVELIRNIDEFLDVKCFLGEETTGYVNTGLGFGAEKGNLIIGEMLNEYKNKKFIQDDGTCDEIPCPIKNTEPLKKYGYKYNDKNVFICNQCTVYPPEYFAPLDYITGRIMITDRTYSIHHYSASWHTKWEDMIARIERCDKTKHLMEYKIRCMVAFPIRIINKIDKIGWKGTILFILNRYKIKN